MSNMSNEPDPIADLANPDQWGPPEPSKRARSEKRRRGVVVSVRLTEEELAVVEGRAQMRGVALGTYIRESALRRMVSVSAPPAVTRPSSGPTTASGGVVASFQASSGQFYTYRGWDNAQPNVAARVAD